MGRPPKDVFGSKSWRTNRQQWGPCVEDRGQIFSHSARPDSLNKHFNIIFFAKCWKLRTFCCRTCMHSKEERDWTAAKKIQQWKLIFFSSSRNEILQLIEERDSFPRLFYSELESTISIGVHGKCKRVVSMQNLTACSGPALVKPSGPAHISYHGIACWRP